MHGSFAMAKRQQPHRPSVSRNVEIGFAEVKDPYQPDHQMTVAKNVRANGIEWLYHRGRLRDNPRDKTDQSDRPRKAAADRYQGIWERAQSHASAIDYSRVKVDMSHAYALGLTQEVTEALQELSRCRVALGPYEPLLTHLCALGGSVRDLDVHYNRDVAGWLRVALDRLIVLWGVAEGQRRRK